MNSAPPGKGGRAMIAASRARLIACAGAMASANAPPGRTQFTASLWQPGILAQVHMQVAAIRGVGQFDRANAEALHQLRMRMTELIAESCRDQTQPWPECIEERLRGGVAAAMVGDAQNPRLGKRRQLLDETAIRARCEVSSQQQAAEAP